MLVGPSRSSIVFAHPQAGNFDDIHLAVGIVGRAVASGLIVRARAFDRAVVLRHVEVYRPRTQCLGDLTKRFDQNAAIRPVIVCGKDSALGRVVAQRIEHGVRHVGLKAKRPGASDLF